MLTDKVYISIAIKNELKYALSIGHSHFYCEYLVNSYGEGNTIWLSNRNYYMLFGLTYLHLPFANSKGFGDDHSLFGCEYLVNGERYNS